MPGAILQSTQLVGTTALAQIGIVPSGKFWRIDLRACNITGGSDSSADVYIGDGSNSGYRCRTYPIPYFQPGSAPDLEFGLIITENQSLQVRAGNASAVSFSLSGEQGDMSSAITPPLQMVASSTGLTDLGAVVPAGKVRRVDLRACNITTGADASLDLYLTQTGNSGYRHRTYPIPFFQPGSAPDVEYGWVLTAGQKLQARASAASAVGLSLTQVEDDA